MDLIASKVAYACFAITVYTLYKSVYSILLALSQRIGTGGVDLFVISFDIVKRRTYVLEMKEMHEEYSVIIVTFV